MPLMLSLIHRMTESFGLNLAGLNVVVPAASGYMAAAATIALLGGASSVTAVTRPSNRYYSAQEAADVTHSLAALARVDQGLAMRDRIDHQTCSSTNILLNSEPIRPITRSIVERLPPHSAIATLREAWMVLDDDLDMDACREHEIPVAAVNQSHPLIGGAEFQPALCLKMFETAGMAVDRAVIALICDNPLAYNLQRGLREAGAQVVVFQSPDVVFSHPWDAVVLAQRPERKPRLDIGDLGKLAKVAVDTVVVQYWGDIDRKAARYFGLKVWPPRSPGKGQMGMPIEMLGPEPMLRLIAGALKSAELVLAGEPLDPEGVAQRVDDDGPPSEG
ncbi:hypothetical protein [Chelativorans sp. AA-79]|uniref:hypothetical protein n=1 Tax=Chelativorans sp. AA-79 TaxID=3028735 RepID=UPI0023F9EFE4|nr:hypothetical protein [Chelativorans sp. AA-79]WEX10471.1 hypothetical protein PVE73_05810 [Chelativorans sp. AA-79]